MAKRRQSTRRPRNARSDLLRRLRLALLDPGLDLDEAQRILESQPERQLSAERIEAIVRVVGRHVEQGLPVECWATELRGADPGTRLPTEYAIGALRMTRESGDLHATHWVLPDTDYGTRIFSSRVNADGATAPEPIVRGERITDWSEAVVCDVWHNATELDTAQTRTWGQEGEGHAWSSQSAWEAGLVSGGEVLREDGAICEWCCSWVDCSDPDVWELLRN